MRTSPLKRLDHEATGDGFPALRIRAFRRPHVVQAQYEVKGGYHLNQVLGHCLSAGDLTALSAALQSGSITPEVFSHLLSQAEMLPPDIDPVAYAETLRAEKEARGAKAAANGATVPAPEMR